MTTPVLPRIRDYIHTNPNLVNDANGYVRENTQQLYYEKIRNNYTTRKYATIILRENTQQFMRKYATIYEKIRNNL